jgi:hypothetical protein
MSSSSSGSLPKLGVSDFRPGMDHVVDVHQNGRIIAFVHKDDPVRQHLATLHLVPSDPYTYVFIHGGQETSQFENMQYGTHEIPEDVVARLLVNEYGGQLVGMRVRMCTCYGNLLRPGDTQTVVQRLAGLLPKTVFEAYHGLIHVDPMVSPPRLILSNALAWDPISGPYYLHPAVPGKWEPVSP